MDQCLPLRSNVALSSNVNDLSRSAWWEGTGCLCLKLSEGTSSLSRMIHTYTVCANQLQSEELLQEETGNTPMFFNPQKHLPRYLLLCPGKKFKGKSWFPRSTLSQKCDVYDSASGATLTTPPLPPARGAGTLIIRASGEPCNPPFRKPWHIPFRKPRHIPKAPSFPKFS